jgi:hypothetical protein
VSEEHQIHRHHNQYHKQDVRHLICIFAHRFLTLNYKSGITAGQRSRPLKTIDKKSVWANAYYYNKEINRMNRVGKAIEKTQPAA